MSPVQNTQTIYTMLKRGQIKDAAKHAQALVKQYPEQAEYWHLLSLVAMQLRQASKAIEFSQKALTLDTDNLNYKTQYAVALQHNLQFAEAIEQAKAIEVLLNQSAQPATTLLDSLGTIYTHCGDVKSAQRLYERAVELEPNSPHLLFNLATAYRGNGLMAEAEALYNKVIALNPADFEAYANRSQLRKLSKNNNHVKQLESLLKQGIKNWRDESSICFALAKECEDTEDHTKSFDYLKRGADLRRQNMNYQVEHDIQAIDKIIQTFNPDTIANASKGCKSAEPVFILGLPRTGTTLVERILDSHSQVFSAGELQNFASCLINLVAKTFSDQKLDKMTMIEKSVAIDFEALGNNYIHSTRPATGHSPHFIDKLPLNYLYIGLIKMALPNAKIIHLTRNPMDACYAIYKTAFKDAYPFSYDLNDLGQYYLAYHRLMKHWHQVFPEQIFEINYETLVYNQELESKKLLSFCNLDWEQSCLQFYKNPQASMTASAAQVRQPIYTGSVGKWQHYQEQLKPLSDLFTKHQITFE